MRKIIFLVLAMVLLAGCVQGQYCGSMSLSEAKEIAVGSECGDRLKAESFCNSDTGTYWIDLDIEREMCNPACVVNVATREAVINWRCMGALP